MIGAGAPAAVCRRARKASHGPPPPDPRSTMRSAPVIASARRNGGNAPSNCRPISAISRRQSVAPSRTA
ncbi:MAG TPA: hypothetical protein PL187_06130, partial [Caldilinea sp.]|nr:hypothetical protein [Caldilinea sp.]